MLYQRCLSFSLILQGVIEDPFPKEKGKDTVKRNQSFIQNWTEIILEMILSESFHIIPKNF